MSVLGSRGGNSISSCPKVGDATLCTLACTFGRDLKSSSARSIRSFAVRISSFTICLSSSGSRQSLRFNFANKSSSSIARFRRIHSIITVCRRPFHGGSILWITWWRPLFRRIHRIITTAIPKVTQAFLLPFQGILVGDVTFDLRT